MINFKIGDRVRLKRGQFESATVRSIGYEAVGEIVSIRRVYGVLYHYVQYPNRKRTFSSQANEIELVGSKEDAE